ncbi:hypothetical protein GCM10022243_29730 [Saccharothrix violaceirubra]|uniref:TIR domain-containing protein n=1 Tax=Saccharothrix violaceirubra TaxID=413306 RepID=A0A7W7T5Z3_9PSEU|nr:TIR domain-containing protein [Saccharothrix violaceirubra]MBB4966597.1 hypothetical protein [Saccharothrix violaceirubra]
MSRSYDVCLSFAGEQRAYVEEVARLLRAGGVEVFYDQFETADLWGRDLAVHLDDVFRHRSRYCVLFASADYARKMWTSHERASALDRALRDRDDYLLPVRFDDTEIPGLRRSTGYLDARRLSPGEIVAALIKRIGAGDSLAVPCTILAVRGSVDVRRLFDDASRECGIAVDVVGEHGVVPLDRVSTGDVVRRLVPVLAESRLVVGVHRGEVPEGDSVDLAVASALVEVTDAERAVVLSQRVYDEVVRGSGRARQYVGVPLASGGTAWVRGSGRQGGATGARVTVIGDNAVIGQVGDRHDHR